MTVLRSMLRAVAKIPVLATILLGSACSGDLVESGSSIPNPPATLRDPRTCMSTTLPRITVAGNELRVRCAGNDLAVRIKGINRSGLQHKSSLAMAGFPSNPQQELHRFRTEWQTVAIRLPIAQDSYLNSASYRDDIAKLVAAARSEGQYLILEVHGFTYDLNPALPNAQTSTLWDMLAQQFGSESHVLFDLWNEPRAASWDVWKTQAEILLRTIRNAGAQDTVVLVGGLDYAYDLSALSDAKNRIIGLGPVLYATHPYPFKGVPPHVEPDWDRYFGNVSREVPVILGEYGVDEMIGDKAAARDWMSRLHRYIDSHSLSALAWSVGDKPHLVDGQNGGMVSLPANPPDPGKPTDPYGIDVKTWMLQP